MSQGSAATGTAATRPVVQQTAAAAWSLPPGAAYRPRLPSPSYPTELPDTRTGPKSRLSIGLPELGLLGPGIAPRPVRIVRIFSFNWSPVTDRTVVLSYHGRIGSVSLAPRRYSVRWSKGMLPRRWTPFPVRKHAPVVPGSGSRRSVRNRMQEMRRRRTCGPGGPVPDRVGRTESEHGARLTVVCFAPIIFCRIHLRVRAAEYRLSRSGKLDQAASSGLGPAVPSGPDTASDSYVFASSGTPHA